MIYIAKFVITYFIILICIYSLLRLMLITFNIEFLKIDWNKKYMVKYNETFDTKLTFVEADIYILKNIRHYNVKSLVK